MISHPEFHLGDELENIGARLCGRFVNREAHMNWWKPRGLLKAKNALLIDRNAVEYRFWQSLEPL